MAKGTKRAKPASALNFPELESSFSTLFPESGKILLTGGGKEFVERIGEEVIRNVVLGVLCGENLRTQTEPLSRRRIAQVSGAIIAMFTKGFVTIPDFKKKLSRLALDQLQKARGNVEVWPSQWVIGLTGKLAQNLLRKPDELYSYVKDFESAIEDAAKHCRDQIGEYSMTLSQIEKGKEMQYVLDWESMARLTTAIGAQTLAIRGSEKSMYGELFERLILGSVLTLLGFKRTDPKTNKESQGVFWLSDSSDIRESDATVIVSPGKLARFDIGFIGRGNPEISKDKLTRFSNTVEYNTGVSSSSVTFVIVDTLPNTGKTQAAANKSGTELIQMSMQFWSKELSIKLKERFGYIHPMQNLSDSDLHEYIRKNLLNIRIQEFLSGVTVEGISEDPETVGDTEIFEDE